MARIRFIVIILILFIDSSLSFGASIYQDTQNKFRFEIPEGWVVENQSQDPLTLILKKSEKDKLGLDPLIILTKVDFVSAMPKDKLEVEEIIKNIEIPKDSSKIKSFKVLKGDLVRTEKNYWFYYLTEYLYQSSQSSKWEKMNTLNYLIKTADEYYSLVLVSPKKELKSQTEVIEKIAISLQKLFLP